MSKEFYWVGAFALLSITQPVLAQEASKLKPAQITSEKTTLGAADRMFLEEMGRMRLGEVESSRLAVKEGKAPEIRQVAQDILDYHDRTDPKLRAIAADANVKLPSEVDKARSDFLKQLRTKTGTDFDRSYVEGQKADHQHSVELFKKVQKEGRNPKLKSFVDNSVADAVQMEKKVNEAAAKI